MQIKNIANSPERILLDQKQRKLIDEMRQGNTKAEILLIETCDKLIYKIVKKYTANKELQEALSTAGQYGLIMAAQRFDLARQNFFTTYAVWWIKQAIINRLKEEQPFDHHLSLDTPLTFEDQERTMHDIIGDTRHTQQSLEQKLITEDQKKVRLILKQLLPHQEYQVLKFRYGLKNQQRLTYKEIAHKLGASKESVKQLEKKALRRLTANTELKLIHAEQVR